MNHAVSDAGTTRDDVSYRRKARQLLLSASCGSGCRWPGPRELSRLCPTPGHPPPMRARSQRTRRTSGTRRGRFVPFSRVVSMARSTRKACSTCPSIRRTRRCRSSANGSSSCSVASRPRRRRPHPLQTTPPAPAATGPLEATSQTAAVAVEPSPPPAPMATPEPAAWRARLALDRARLAFYDLPAVQRAELVRQHQARAEQAIPADHDEALNQAEADGRRAERQQLEALEAARRSRTEAARLINEEHARLLSVTRQQAEYESGLIQRRRRARRAQRGRARLAAQSGGAHAARATRPDGTAARG